MQHLAARAFVDLAFWIYVFLAFIAFLMMYLLPRSRSNVMNIQLSE